MRRALFINTVCGIGSTGKICLELAKELEKQGYECKIAYGRGNVPDEAEKYSVRIGSDYDTCLHIVKTRLFDEHGFGSVRATKKFLEWADNYKPDLLWLHNIHGYYINIEILFEWIKKHPKMQVKWTLHDCWAFTGHCTYFTMANCVQWKNCCEHCVQKTAYPCSYLKDNCLNNFHRKKFAFTGVKNLTLITPSQWLADLVKESFLKDYPVEVRHNTINTSVFKPTHSDFRKKYHLEKKIIVLGVASPWSDRKGLKDFFKLAEILNTNYKIVLIGLNKKQMKDLPNNILGIQRTDNQEELAGIYTTANVLVNPTYEDNYPTVNLEAEACGTPVITYRTGGSPESVPKANVVDVGDIDGLKKLLLNPQLIKIEEA